MPSAHVQQSSTNAAPAHVHHQLTTPLSRPSANACQSRASAVRSRPSAQGHACLPRASAGRSRRQSTPDGCFQPRVNTVIAGFLEEGRSRFCSMRGKKIRSPPRRSYSRPAGDPPCGRSFWPRRSGRWRADSCRWRLWPSERWRRGRLCGTAASKSG